MRTKTSLTGKRGEAAVAGFLAAKGHKIVARNWRSGHLELDIVSLDGSGLHFVEVKTRTSSDIAAPQENVGAVKQRRLAEAAKRFWRARAGNFGAWRCFLTSLLFWIATTIWKSIIFRMLLYRHTD